MAPTGWRIPVWNAVMNEETATPDARPAAALTQQAFPSSPPDSTPVAMTRPRASGLSFQQRRPRSDSDTQLRSPKLGQRDHPHISPSQSVGKA